MSLGKQIRMNRLFAHPSGRLCSVAVDHASGYQHGLPQGLTDLPGTIKTLMIDPPSAMTMHKGPAKACWGPYAGRIPLILQSSFVRPDDTANELVACPEDALRLGADAFAVVGYMYGPTEATYVRRIAEMVRQAEPWGLPVILHVYPRKYSTDGACEISFEPEHIAWAVRCGIEVGVDIIKVPYTGNVKSYRDIVRSCPVPIVAAGGPKTATVRGALDLAAGAIAAGAKGLTIGRNIWGTREPVKTLRAFKSVILEKAEPEMAMKKAGVREK